MSEHPPPLSRRELRIRPLVGKRVYVFCGNEPLLAFENEALAQRAITYWQAQLAGGTMPPWGLSEEIILADAAAASERKEREMMARLAAIEKRLAANPPDRPGWGAAPLPITFVGRIAALLRRHYKADLPRKEIERRLKLGEDHFRFPEPFDIGPFGLTSLKAALALARK
jgi:hypothetical protein